MATEEKKGAVGLLFAAQSCRELVEASVLKYESGDYVKVELESKDELPGEWVWLRVQSADDHRRVVFGSLDNQPIATLTELKLGQSLAVSYDKIRDHRKSSEFPKSH